MYNIYKYKIGLLFKKEKFLVNKINIMKDKSIKITLNSTTAEPDINDTGIILNKNKK